MENPNGLACTRDLKGGGHKAGKKFEVNENDFQS